MSIVYRNGPLVMGPSILFDKSAIQSLNQSALDEVNRYFYTLVPPVLLMEILADLSRDPDDVDGSREKVTGLARKILATDSIVNIHYHSLCVHNLLGEAIPMDRTPVVGGGNTVVTKDGSKGRIINAQSEEQAVLRWSRGQVNEDDMTFADQYRHSAHGTNLEEMKQALPKSPYRIRSLDQLVTVVDVMLADSEYQEPLLHWFLTHLRCERQTADRIRFRWRLQIVRSLKAFAPYAVHCLRTHLLYYVGMIHGILGTRPSNIVDLEYLCYSPFAFVFCSGDKLHRQLAPLILEGDQSFVDREEMRKCLNEMATSRKDARDSEPGEDSLIRQLWMKHWKKAPRQAKQKSLSEEQIKKIMKSAKPILEALQKQDRSDQPRFPV